MTRCGQCGLESPHGNRFCSGCGGPLAADPVAAPVPPAANVAEITTAQSRTEPVATTAQASGAGPTEDEGSSDRASGRTVPALAMPTVDLSRVLSGDWAGAAKVATATLGTALVLSIGMVALMHPDGFGFMAYATTVVAMTGSAFGGDLAVRVSQSGQMLTTTLGAYPLTITLAALGAGGNVFWRQVRGYPRALDAVLQAARAAVLIAIPMAVLSVVFRSSLALPSDLTDALDYNFDGKVGTRTVSATALSAMYLFTVCAATVLLRRDWLAPRVRKAANWLATPLTALAASLGATVVAGLVVAVVATFQAEDVDTLPLVAVLLAALPNLGLWAFLSGTGAGMRLLGESSDASARHDKTQYLATLADDVSRWVWVVPLVTLLVLAVGALVVVRRCGSVEEARKTLLRWLVVTVAVVPLLAHFAAVHAHLDYVAGPDSFDSDEWADMLIAISGWQATLLVAVWAFVVAVITASLLRQGETTPGANTPSGDSSYRTG